MKRTFHKNKYGEELLIDCGGISETRGFVKDTTPFYVTFNEIVFITRGKGLFKLDDEEIPFERGTVLLLPQNRWRQWAVIEEPMDGFFLIFEEEFVAHFFNDALFLYRFHYFYNHAAPSFIQAGEGAFSQMLVKLKEIQAELKGLRHDSHHLLRSILYYLLIQINRIYEQAFDLSDSLFQETLPLKFRKLLEHHILEKQKVSDYTEMLNVSKSHLNNTLKRYFGKSCSEIIKERLIVHIKKELLFSEKSVSEISYEMNFSEPGNFIRFFKSMTQTTPREFRQLNSK